MGGTQSRHREAARALQDAKETVRALHLDLDGLAPEGADQALRRHLADDIVWRGVHPFGDLTGLSAVADGFWRPLSAAFTDLQRRTDIFFAGENWEVEDAEIWVCSMGHLVGLFDRQWLGIPPTGKMAFLRFVEFDRVERGRVVETTFMCDLIDLMRQGRLNPLPDQSGAAILVPGPRTHDGLSYGEHDPDEARETRRVIDAMVAALMEANLHGREIELRECWHDDMIWWGPAGVGSSYTVSRYEEQHRGPFRAGLDRFEYYRHPCAIAEGNYGGFFGWPSLAARPTGGWLGLPAGPTSASLRVVDIYRRRDDKLAENWVFMDLLDFLRQQGVDVLARMSAVSTHEWSATTALTGI